MSGTEGEPDYRTGSADSENSSDSFVQVNKEDAPPQSEQLMEGEELVPSPPPDADETAEQGPGIPASDDIDDMYGEETVATSEEKELDVQFMASTDPDEEEKEEPKSVTPPPSVTPPVSSGVEEVPKPAEPVSQAPSTPASSSGEVVPVPSGYLRFLRHLSPLVLYVIYWRDLKLSAVVLGVCLMTLLTLSLNTFIHTLVLIQLSFLVVTLTYIVTKIAIDSFYNRDVANPFRNFLSSDVVFPEEKILEWTKCIVKKMESWFNVFVKLMLFHNIKRSLKYGVALWLMSFFTNCMTILTALFIDVALLFSVPVLYEKFQPIIDEKIDTALKKACEVINKVRNHIPSYIPVIGKPKVE